MIPMAIMGGAAALFGYLSSEEAKDKNRRANEINKEAAEIALNSKAEIESANTNMNTSLERLGRNETSLLQGDVASFDEMMKRIYDFGRRNNPSGLDELKRMGFNENVVNEVGRLARKAYELSSIPTIKNDGSSFAAVGLIGTGALLAGSAIAGPAMLLYGLMQSDEATAAIYEASSRLDEAKLFRERCKNICVLFDAIGTRARQIDNLLDDLDRYFEPTVREVRRIVNGYNGYNFAAYPDYDKQMVFLTYQLMETIKIVVEAPLIQDDWSLNPDIDSKIALGRERVALLK